MFGGCCDIAAIEQARGGDQRAFAHLYRRYSRQVLSLCRRMTRDASFAEDCMQEAFFNAWRAIHRYETRARFTSWLHRIAVNVVLAKRRKHSPHTDTAVEIEQLEESEWSMDTPVEEREIQDAIEELPEGARNVLMLSAIGYSHPEAAEILGLAEGTCKAQLHRARQLLRVRLLLQPCLKQIQCGNVLSENTPPGVVSKWQSRHASGRSSPTAT